MDTATRTLTHRIAFFLCLVVSATILGAQAPAPARAALSVHGASAAEERAVDWALRRYREAGLQEMPALDVYLHESDIDCNGGIGLYFAGRIDLCTKGTSEPYARKFALHEMAHAWTQANVDPQTLARFMEVRGVATWNDRSFEWKERGNEQVAEIIAWGLGEGIRPLLPETEIDDRELAELFELLTGHPPINAIV